MKNNLPGDRDLLEERTRELRESEERFRPVYGEDSRFLERRVSNRDISERKQTEESLRIMAEMLDNAPGSITVHDMDGRFLYGNQKTFSLHGYDRDEFMAINLHDLDVPESEALIGQRMRLIQEKGEAAFEVSHFRKDGTVFPLEIFTKNAIWAGKPAILSIATDITERKKVEAEREKMQGQLNQAQKMESVGRLAGGIAHDFNNMLGVIMGQAEMALEKMDLDDPLFPELQEIWKAANHSADLTRQLLAFARKQMVSPKVIDLNETIEGMLKMLRRLIGEDIDLIWRPGPGLWPIKIDPAQIDQILANLCINSRDAIKDVGKVVIQTETASFGDIGCTAHPDCIPGEYVLLAVKDDGCGMGKQTLDNLFEPFFTTKEVGKGTGLGLATVYGIVKQNNGFIDVQSTPGEGTIISIGLPRHAGDFGNSQITGSTTTAQKGSETILVVEDEPGVLKMTTMMLKRLGYAVLTAKTPGEAIRLSAELSGKIELLITDVVMPEMSGRDLAKSLLRLYPNLKILFMSGYTADVISHHGVLEEGLNFIRKPFFKHELAAKVRETLDGE
jgi:two-component system, cell cycle sensor histidine kinase and response regulator CckA